MSAGPRQNTEQVWDAIVVGAGPAGCAAAYDLAAAGRRVLLLDKAEFPRPKACAGALTSKALKTLRYSVAPVTRLSVHTIVLEPPQPSAAGSSIATVSVTRRKALCAMTVREELDAFCLGKTRERGAAFERIGSIASITQTSGGVEVVVETAGERHTICGQYLVGADGVHSRVRTLLDSQGDGGSECACHSALSVAWADTPTAVPLRAASGAHRFRRGFALEANVPYAATDGRAFPLTFDFGAIPGGYGWLFPRNDHVNVGLYLEDASADGRVLDRAALESYIAVRCGTREHSPIVGQYLGLGAAGYRPPSRRVLLVGDAAGFVDPLTGEGIYGAIASGQSAARAILDALRAGSLAPLVARFHAYTAEQCNGLRFAERAASRFYAEPEQGFRFMRLPLLQRAAVHAFVEGTGFPWLTRLFRLARFVRLGARLKTES